MARDTKKRQKKLQKKNAKRKEKRGQISRRSAAMVAPSLSRSKEWPLEAAWITADWRKPEQLVQTLFIRRSSNDHIALGNVLVDTMCLGVKNAYGRVTDEFEYQETLEMMRNNQQMIPADLNLIAKIIQESVAYAAELGFRPDKGLRQAMVVLGNADPDACSEDVRLGGPDGKPYFFAGPNDNVDRIMNILTKKVGSDGFQYTIPVGDPDDDDLYFINESEGYDGSADDDGTIVLDEKDFKSLN